MPKVYKKSRVYKRKYFKKVRHYRKRGARISTTNVRSLTDSDRLRVKLKYSYLGSALGTVSADFNWVPFNLNSPVDPGITLTTTNATAIAQYGNIYQNYFCHGSSIKVQVVNMDVDVPFRVGVVPLPRDIAQTMAPTDDNGLIANAYAKTKIIGNATGMDAKTIRHYMSIRKLTGKPGANSSDATLYGATPQAPGGAYTLPTSTFQWVVTAQALSSVTDNLDIMLAVELIYYVEFFNRSIYVAQI